MSIDVKLAELMMKFVTKVCNRHNGLRVIWCDYE